MAEEKEKVKYVISHRGTSESIKIKPKKQALFNKYKLQYRQPI